MLFLVFVADLPAMVLGSKGGSIGSCTNNDRGAGVEVGFSAYADDALCLVAGRYPEKVVNWLGLLSDAMLSYTTKNYILLNEGKTQVLWPMIAKGALIKVGSCSVSPTDKLEELRVTFNRLFSPTPYMSLLILSSRSLTSTTRRLSLHLAKDLLKKINGCLYRAKTGYMSLVSRPRLKRHRPHLCGHVPAPGEHQQIGHGYYWGEED